MSVARRAETRAWARVGMRAESLERVVERAAFQVGLEDPGTRRWADDPLDRHRPVIGESEPFDDDRPAADGQVQGSAILDARVDPARVEES